MSEEASSLALVELLRQRNLTLDQQIRDVVQRNKSLEQQLDAQHREAARKRRKLQCKIQEAQNALRLKDEDIRRLQRQLSETIDALDAERDRTDKLQQLGDDEADRSLMESALRAVHVAHRQHTVCEPRTDIACRDKPGCGDFDTPEDTGDQYQKKELCQSLLSREEDVAVTLTKIIPQLCGSRDDREQQGGYVDSRHRGTVSTGYVDTDEYAGQASRPGLTQLLKEAGETLNAHQETRWRDMMEREKVLTCPLSQDLFQDAVVTECCGKTASWEPLRQALAQTSVCPFCNAKEGYVHRNADMETLVELHRSERSALSDIAFITARTAAHLTVAFSRPSQRVDAVLRPERRSERDESTDIYRLPISVSNAEAIDDDATGDFREADTYQTGLYAQTASPTTGESGAPSISPSTLSRPPTSIDARRTCRYLFEPSAASRATLETPGKSLRKDPDAASRSSFRSPVSSEPTASLTAWAHEFSRPRKRRAAEDWRFPEYA